MQPGLDRGCLIVLVMSGRLRGEPHQRGRHEPTSYSMSARVTDGFQPVGSFSCWATCDQARDADVRRSDVPGTAKLSRSPSGPEPAVCEPFETPAVLSCESPSRMAACAPPPRIDRCDEQRTRRVGESHRGTPASWGVGWLASRSLLGPSKPDHRAALGAPRHRVHR